MKNENSRIVKDYVHAIYEVQLLCRESEDPDKLHANVTTMTFHICKSLAEHKETLSRKNDFIMKGVQNMLI